MIEDRITLLVVDDDTDDRDLFIEAVREVSEDIQCIIASDGQQALHLLRSLQYLPDLIFLDLRMPRIDGKNCLAEIKQDEKLKNIPVVVYTTSREVEDSNDLKRLGAVHFVSKPTNPDEIFYLVAFVLEEHLLNSAKNLRF